MKKLIIFAFIATMIAVSAGCTADRCWTPWRRTPSYQTFYTPTCVDECFTGCPTACPPSDCGPCGTSSFGGQRFVDPSPL